MQPFRFGPSAFPRIRRAKLETLQVNEGMRKIIGVVGVFIPIFVVGAGLYLAFFFDANRYKADLIAAVREATGRELQIDGDLSVALFPEPHARTDVVRLLNPEDFSESAFAEIDSASASVRLLPLFKRQIQIEEVVIDGLHLDFVKHRDGEHNWSNLMPVKNRDSSEGDNPFKVLVQRLRLCDAEISFRDESNGRKVSISEIELDTGRPGRSVPVQVKAKVSSEKPKLEGAVSLTGDVFADPHNRKYAANQVDLTFVGSAARLRKGDITAELKGDAALDLEAQSLSAGLTATLLHLAIEGKLAANAIGSEPRFNGKLSIAEFNPRALLASLGRPIPDTRDKSVLTRAKISFDVAGDGSGLTIEPIAGRLDSSKVDGKIMVTNYDAPGIRFHLKVDKIDVDRYRPAKPEPPSIKDNAIVKLSEDSLRGFNIAGDARIGTLVLAGDRTQNYRVIVEAGP